jgi:hypothetical protein
MSGCNEDLRIWARIYDNRLLKASNLPAPARAPEKIRRLAGEKDTFIVRLHNACGSNFHPTYSYASRTSQTVP